MSKCKVFKCDCDHKFQDEHYGKGNRLYNYGEKVHGHPAGPGWRCTVCERTRGN